MAKLLKRSPHYGMHLKNNPKGLFDFAGWEMPTHFSSLEEEVRACREAAILFDGHAMGEFHIKGREALRAVQKLCANDLGKAQRGNLVYTSMCTESGGIFDDLVVFCLGPQHYLLTVAAFNVDKASAWIEKHIAGMDAYLCNQSAGTTCIEVQGPESRAILQKVAQFDVSNAALPYYRFAEGKVGEVDCLVGRLGVTGELGYEIFYDAGHAWYMYELLQEAGKGHGLQLCGNRTIGIMRLEKVYHIYNREIDEATNPFEAGLGRAVKLEKGDFVGRDALRKIKERGNSRKLVGLIAEPGTKVAAPKTPVSASGHEVGYITAMANSPTLNKPIALAYVQLDASEVGTQLTVGNGSDSIKMTVTTIPFYDPNGTRLRN
jgi:aminomethyltransferase